MSMDHVVRYRVHPEPVVIEKHSTDTQSKQFSRKELEGLSSGNLSTYFGDWFKPLDHYERLIRMPEPPLLLADRVTNIEAHPGSMGTGSIFTETDVKENAWYLHHGRMPAGIMIESGQADLLLASWLGFDQENKGERVYRLLGCDVMYLGELPKPGDTLCYDIHIDGQAKVGGIRLFFFHYDCRINGEVRLRVKNGQAGFFSEAELAKSEGVLWDPNKEKCDTRLLWDLPTITTKRHAFTRDDLRAFATGNSYDCFGEGFEWTETHTRSPAIPGGNLLLLDAVTHFEVKGGPWQRGYLRAVQTVHEEDWFFKGHFKNDPCMPGTLMLEAGLAALSFYMAALGFTIQRDGWRFEPMTDEWYTMRCRGEVRPQAKEIVYELFITSVVQGPIPMVKAHLLATVDGLKAFHTAIGMRLVPDWPYQPSHHDIQSDTEYPVASVDGFQFNHASLLACALGKPSTAFGDRYRVFDNHRRVARLPNPPYHFMSRVISVTGQMGLLKSGATLECEYIIPHGAWYFTKEQPSMPFCVLLESALQPCGWLASYLGSTLQGEEDLVFRNLDGTGTLLREVEPTAKVLRTKVTATHISKTAGMIIERFQVQSYVDGLLCYEMETVFGFFPASAFAHQPGLPIPEEEKHALQQSSILQMDLKRCPEIFFNKTPALPNNIILMLDKITGYWPHGGKKGLGLLRAEKQIVSSEWFFKAHFFQDPVQPGSLGLEALIQLVQCYFLLNKNQASDHQYFEPLALNHPITWKYRGQVIPTNKKVELLIEVIEETDDTVIADGSLWVDGKRIYEVKGIGVKAR